MPEMQILPKIPPTLARRAIAGHVPIRCGCRTTFLWERRRGAVVRCPTCLTSQELPIEAAVVDTSAIPASD